MAGQPTNVVLLTADAFGVLPPISPPDRGPGRSTTSSAATPRSSPARRSGVKEPQATFSACFGAPFMPRHPGEYAAMLADRLHEYGVRVWLVNTGWTGGPVRDRRADEHQPHPLDGPGGALGRARRRRVRDRPGLRGRGPADLPRRPERGPPAARDLGRRRGLRPPGGARWPGCSSRTSPPTRTACPEASAATPGPRVARATAPAGRLRARAGRGSRAEALREAARESSGGVRAEQTVRHRVGHRRHDRPEQGERAEDDDDRDEDDASSRIITENMVEAPIRGG